MGVCLSAAAAGFYARVFFRIFLDGKRRVLDYDDEDEKKEKVEGEKKLRISVLPLSLERRIGWK